MFPLVEVKIGGKVKEYSSVLNWFNFVEKFNKPVPKTINFECIVCGKKSIGELGKPGNKYKHIKTHKVGADWSDLYEIFKEEVKAKPKKILDKKQLNLVKFFITSNVALEALENPWLRECINVKLSKYSFRNVILPNMMIFLNTIISNKLIDAKFITLITDIWTNLSMSDFLALGACLVNLSLVRETIIIGMIKMPGAHNAENIKKAIESIINKIKFNKNKIVAVVTDEGSNLLRLFKQIDDSYYIESFDESDINDESNKEKVIEINDSEDSDGYEEEEEEEEESEVSEEEEEKDTSEEEEEIMVYDQFVENSTNFLISSSNNKEKEEIEENDTNPTNLFTEDEISSLHIENPMEYTTTSRIIDSHTNLDSQNQYEQTEEYDFNGVNELITCLELEIGSTRIPRFSCVCHKGNLAIRKAITQSSHFSELLKSLSKQATSIKRSIVLSGRHRQLKCKIHRQNFTRWSSSFMMLISYLKSYQKGVFTNENKCAASENELEKYIQILLPMYIFTNDSQSEKATIASVVPSILSIIYANLDRMVLDNVDQNLFRNNLIFFIKKKFEYELTSKTYLVAALLNVETLNEWKDRSYGKPYFKKSLEFLLEVVKMF